MAQSACNATQYTRKMIFLPMRGCTFAGPVPHVVPAALLPGPEADTRSAEDKTKARPDLTEER